jgi:uncharacterized membrane protein YraQ (UPF0718 family)
MIQNIILKAINSGIYALFDYLGAHVLTCLVPAFFIAGAMAAILPKEKILKYLGKNSPKYIAYPLSVVAGLLLAICSCTILPLFAGIKKKGAGIGPAIAFLYTAPATNLLAIIYTGALIGWDLAIARILLSITFAVTIGIIISKLFKEEKEESKEFVSELIEEQRKLDGIDGLPLHKRIVKRLEYHRLIIFFAILFSILIIGAWKLFESIRIIGLTVLVAFLLIVLKFWFKKEEIKNWLKETYRFFKTIFPLLLVGVFFAGVLTGLLPEKFLANYVGSNTILTNLAGVLFGVFMYFPTLVEVPMAKTFLSLGMGRGPLLAYLLADPVTSLPSLLVVGKIMGKKRTLAYALLIIFFCTLSGLIYGSFVVVE